MICKNQSLRQLNTFGFDISALLYAEIRHSDELKSLWKTTLLSQSSPLILGGGSNILFTADYPGLVLQNRMNGFSIEKEDGDSVWVRIGGGENWHQTVIRAIEQGWGGIENLSLIPGTAGAAPIQNIGAYGVELKDTFHSLSAFDMAEGKMTEFMHDECRFGYRDSIFKQEGKGRFFICDITLKLSKKPQIHLQYGDILSTLESRGISQPSIADVSRAVIQIRQSKLPDPAVIGNCGSFFKNPVISRELATELGKTFPDLRTFDQPDGKVKIPAGWLIEKAGWKGFRRGDAGVHEKQALVLVNYGGATGREIRDLAREIGDDIQSRFGIRLEMEVNVI